MNITISEHWELTRTVNAVSESKNIHTRGFREHCGLSLSHVRKRSFLGPEFTKLYLAAGLRPDPLGELTALPQTLSCMKGGEGQEMGMKERGKGKEPQKAKRKRSRGQEKGGELGKQLKMGCVSRIVKMHYWQPYRLAPLKISCPLFGLTTQKSWRRHCHYLVKCQCQKTTENKTSSVATRFKKLTTGNNVFIVSYKVSNWHIPHAVNQL